MREEKRDGVSEKKIERIFTKKNSCRNCEICIPQILCIKLKKFYLSTFNIVEVFYVRGLLSSRNFSFKKFSQ